LTLERLEQLVHKVQPARAVAAETLVQWAALELLAGLALEVTRGVQAFLGAPASKVSVVLPERKE